MSGLESWWAQKASQVKNENFAGFSEKVCQKISETFWCESDDSSNADKSLGLIKRFSGEILRCPEFPIDVVEREIVVKLVWIDVKVRVILIHTR
jgi:hypothetical protein